MNDLRFAIRQLFKSSGFATIAILTLALGIGLNTSMFSLMNELLLRPVPYADKDHLVRVARTTPQEPQAAHCAADVIAIQREAADFVQLGAYRLWGFTLAEPGRSAVSLNGLRASAEFFSILGSRPLLGRTFTPEENLPGHAVVILSHTTWQSQFGGDPGVIDRVVQIDGQATTIIGVMPPEFTSLFLWGPTDVFCPLAITEMERANRAETGFMLVGRFKPDLTLEQLNTRLATVAHRLADTRPREQSEDGLQARTLQSTVNSPESIAGVVLMVGLAGGVLLIVCGNLANLQLARATARMREFAIRAALGASRRHLLRPLLAESMVLAIVGGALGILVALWSNQWIVYTMAHELPFQLHFNLRLDWRVLMFAISVSLGTGVLFGLMPAWLASRVRVNSALKSSGRGTTGDRSQHRFRNSLIVLQFAAALVLLACAGFFMRGLSYMSARDPGWDTHQVAQAILNLPNARYTAPEQTYGFYTQAQERLRALPGVENVSVAWSNPMFAFLTTRGYVVEGREPPAPGREPRAFVNGITPTFLDTIGMKLLSGRNFSESDRFGGPPVAMINQSMANALFPGQNPVGQRVVPVNAATRDPVEIVGVFADVGLAGNPTPQPTPFQLFLPLGQECWNYVTISVRSSNPVALIDPMRRTLEALDPTIPVQALSTADKLAASGLVVMQVMTKLLATFGALGLFLAAIGLYGVIARLVVQRTTEIGVRVALGAQARDVLWLVLGSGLRLTLIGAAIGLVLSFVLAFVLRAMVQNDAGIDFVTMLIVTAVLLVVALLASYLPARRATKVDPLTALRAE